MASGVTIKVEGLKELGIFMRNTGDVQLPKALRLANVAAADVIAVFAQTAAPRRLGKLAGSIRGTGTTRAASIRAGGGSVLYAQAVHWGTGPRAGKRGPHNIAPNHFMLRGLESGRAAATDAYEREIAALVKELW